MKHFLFLALSINLTSQVFANSLEEQKLDFVKSFQSIMTEISDALENQNMKNFCSLLVDYDKTLNDGWYYLRSSGYSYEDLKEIQKYIYFNNRDNCL